MQMGVPEGKPMSEIKTMAQAKALFAQMEYLTKLSRASLKQGDIRQAMGQIDGCIRIAHGFRSARIMKRGVMDCAISDHWRLGCCHAALGADQHVQALAHLNVVRRYYKGAKNRARLTTDRKQTAILCYAMMALAKIHLMDGRFNLALLRAEEGLDALYRNESLQKTSAGDLIQMVCFCVRGEALQRLGHGPEVVVRHYEQVLFHYRKYVSNPLSREARKRLIRSGGEHFPWLHDRLRPEATLDQALKAMEAMRGFLSAATQTWVDRLMNEIRVWKAPER